MFSARKYWLFFVNPVSEIKAKLKGNRKHNKV